MQGELRDLDGTLIAAVYGIDGCRAEKRQPLLSSIISVPAREIRAGDSVNFVAERIVNLDYEANYHLILGPVTLLICAAKLSVDRQVRGDVVAVQLSDETAASPQTS